MKGVQMGVQSSEGEMKPRSWAALNSLIFNNLDHFFSHKELYIHYSEHEKQLNVYAAHSVKMHNAFVNSLPYLCYICSLLLNLFKVGEQINVQMPRDLLCLPQTDQLGAAQGSSKSQQSTHHCHLQSDKEGTVQ